jgi:hypothetical protein
VRIAVVLLGLLIALTACDEDCPRVRRCDIRERGCQREVMGAVACMRGGSTGDLPRVSVISEARFLERIRSYGSDDPEALAEAEAGYTRWNRAFALFDLAPAGYAAEDAIADTAGQTAAAYFPGERDIVIIDRGESLADDGAVEIFAHEVVHALQDRELDLWAYQSQWATSFDASLALDAVIEGEAVHYQILAALQLEGRSTGELQWDRLYGAWRADTLREAETDEAPIAFADIRFPYAFGGDLVSGRWLARGRAGIDALFDDPPRTTSEVLFGSDAGALAGARDTLRERSVPVLPAPYVDRGATALGAWIARMYAVRAGVPRELRDEAARELAADAFSVHHDEASDTLIAAWRVRMLEGSSALYWPGAPGPTVHRMDDLVAGEAALIAAEAVLPEDAGLLAWRAPSRPDESDQQMSAAVVRWHSLRARIAHRACAARRPSGGLD